MKLASPLLGIFLFSVVTHASDSPKFDQKLSALIWAEKCADWSWGEIKGISDAKKKGTEFKEHFQKCLSKNGLSRAFLVAEKKFRALNRRLITLGTKSQPDSILVSF